MWAGSSFRREGEELIAVYKYLIAGEEMIDPYSSQRCAVTTHVNKGMLEHRKFCLNIRKKILLNEGGQILKQVPRKAVGSLSLEILKT